MWSVRPFLVATFALAALSACDADLLGKGPLTCVSDDECGRRNACVLGVCVDPRAQALDEVNLEIRPAEESGYRPQQVFGVRVGPGSEDGRTVVELRETIFVRGNVVDASGAPVPAQVVAVPQAGIPGRALVANAAATGVEGAFSLPLVAADEARLDDEYRLAVFPDDVHARPPHYIAGAVRADSPTNELLHGDIELPDPTSLVRISGRVVTSDGAVMLPVKGLEVRLYDGSRRVSTVGVTNDNGEFTLDVTPSAPVLVSLEIRPTEQSRLNPTLRVDDWVSVIDSADLGDIDLGALPAPVPFTGIVRGPSGAPVPGARIYARATVSNELGEGVLNVLTVADEEGHYDAELRPGRYELAAVPPVTDPSAGLLVGFSANVSATSSPQLNLPERVEVSGAVQAADGTDVFGATVQLTRIGAGGGPTEAVLDGVTWTFSATTDGGGGFTLRVDPGRYRVSIVPDPASGLPRDSRVLDVLEPASDLKLVLPAKALIAGQLVTRGGAALEMAQVAAFSTIVGESGEAFELGSALTSGDGRFEIVVPDLAAE